MQVLVAKYLFILKSKLWTSCFVVPMNGSGGSIFTKLLGPACDITGGLGWGATEVSGTVWYGKILGMYGCIFIDWVCCTRSGTGCGVYIECYSMLGIGLFYTLGAYKRVSYTSIIFIMKWFRVLVCSTYIYSVLCPCNIFVLLTNLLIRIVIVSCGQYY